jgi:hypothetical protein
MELLGEMMHVLKELRFKCDVQYRFMVMVYTMYTYPVLMPSSQSGGWNPISETDFWSDGDWLGCPRGWYAGIAMIGLAR